MRTSLARQIEAKRCKPANTSQRAVDVEGDLDGLPESCPLGGSDQVPRLLYQEKGD